jgi:predicted Zn-dependent peptidase
MEAFDAITPDDLCSVAAKFLDPDRLSTLVYL